MLGKTLLVRSFQRRYSSATVHQFSLNLGNLVCELLHYYFVVCVKSLTFFSISSYFFYASSIPNWNCVILVIESILSRDCFFLVYSLGNRMPLFLLLLMLQCFSTTRMGSRVFWNGIRFGDAWSVCVVVVVVFHSCSWWKVFISGHHHLHTRHVWVYIKAIVRYIAIGDMVYLFFCLQVTDFIQDCCISVPAFIENYHFFVFSRISPCFKWN